MLNQFHDLLNHRKSPLPATSSRRAGGAPAVSEMRSADLEISMEHLAEVLNGRLTGFRPGIRLHHIATDTRTLKPGDLFWALKGDKHDGHLFLQDAAGKGACAAVVDETAACGDKATGIPLIRVNDTLRALGELASWHKRRLGLHSVAITGSCGKTSTKSLVAAIFEKKAPVISTYRNFNNLIGLPMTLLNATEQHKWAILEMGMNRPGEIGALARITEADIGLITNIGPAHLEGLRDLEGIAREKSSLWQNLSAGGTAVVNLDDPMICDRLAGFSGRIVGYTMDGAMNSISAETLRLLAWSPARNGTTLCIDISGRRHKIHLRLIGIGNIQNALAALATGYAAGMQVDDMAAALESVRPEAGRLEIKKTARWTILDDTYNANPASMKNALAALAFWADNGPRVAILGEMYELGMQAARLHRDTGFYAARTGISALMAVGSLGEEITKGAEEGGLSRERILNFKNRSELISYLKHRCGACPLLSSWILVKGSRMAGLEEVVETLAECNRSEKGGS